MSTPSARITGRTASLPATALLLGCALSLGGCPSKPRTAFVYARGSDSVRLDPQKVDDGESVLVCSNIFEGLVRYGDGVDIVPALAESWASSNGGLTWTFRLRKGVTFHDGEPFTADAVVFTFERITQKDHPFHDAEIRNQAFYQDIAKVEAASAHLVRFRLRRPVAPRLFLGSLTIYTAFIVSPKAFAKLGPERFAKEPVGTGPFRIAQWVRDQRLVLERFGGYWGGPAKTKKVVIATVKENGSRLQMLMAGEIDAMDGLNPVDVAAVDRDAALEVVRQPGMSVGYLAINQRKPALRDARVRRAIALAIDREKIVALNFHGQGVAARQVCPESVLAVPTDLPSATRDVARAKALLKAGGVEGGLDLELWAMPNPRPYMPEPKKIAELIKEDLLAVGIRATIVTQPWAQYLNKTRAGEHDLCLLGWTADVADADNFLTTFFATKSIGSTNVSFLSDADVDGDLAAAQTVLDAEKRAAIYHRVEARVRELAPLVPLVHPMQLAARRSTLKGFRLHPTGRRLFHDVALK